MLVQDNLHARTAAVFYQHLPAAQARMRAARFAPHYTPKSASWLNMAELELSAIARHRPPSPARACPSASLPRTS